jgi:hypothetical protein
MLGLDDLVMAGLALYIIPTPVWTMWLGIDLLRKPVPFLEA